MKFNRNWVEQLFITPFVPPSDLKYYSCKECDHKIAYGTLCKECFFKEYPSVVPIENFIKEEISQIVYTPGQESKRTIEQEHTMNNTEMVKEAIKIIDSANKADGFTAEIDNTEVQQCLAWKLGVQMSTGEISDIRYTLEHGNPLQDEEAMQEAMEANEQAEKLLFPERF